MMSFKQLKKSNRNKDMSSVLQTEFEQKSNVDLSNVHIHYNSSLPKQYMASAIAHNNQIDIASGKEYLLRHELTHIVQQKQGLVDATEKRGNHYFNTSPVLEKGADNAVIKRKPPTHKQQNIIQMAPITDQEIITQILKAGITYMNSLYPEIIAFFKDADSDDLTTETLHAIIEFVYQTDDASISYLHNLFQEFPFEANIPIYISFIQFIDRYPELAPHLLDITSILGISASDYLINAFSKIPDLVIDTFHLLVKEQHNIAAFSTLFQEQIPMCASNIMVSEKITMANLGDSIYNILGKKAYTLFNDCVSKLVQCCIPASINDVLLGCNLNVSEYILTVIDGQVYTADAAATEIDMKMFLRRLQLTTDYVQSVYDKFHGKYLIKPTGSDPHLQGRQVVFLIDALGGIFIYKNRPLEIDNELAGKNGFLKEVGELLITDPEMQFQGMRIDPVSHMEEVISPLGDPKTEALDLETAKRNYFQLGALQAIASVTGIVDLHADNIIFSAVGLHIIDAECSFLSFTDTLIEHDKSSPFIMIYSSSLLSYTNSVFSIKMPDDKVVLSTTESPQLMEMFYKGKNYTMIKIKAEKADFLQILSKHLVNILSSRIVPIATGDFAESMHGYAFSNKADKEALLMNTIERISTNLMDDSYAYMTGQPKPVFQPDVMYNVLYNAFENHTIPALEFQWSTSKIYMDSQEICALHYRRNGTIVSFVLEKVAQMIDCL